MAKVFLTAPHSACEDLDLKKIEHMCDLVASAALYAIKAALSREKIPVWTIYADVNRRRLDLNRIASRNSSQFREGIRSAVHESGGNLKILLDIHSFNSDYLPWEGYEVAILDDRKLSRKLESYNMVTWLEQHGVAVKYVQGISNDIQDEMHLMQDETHPQGIESFLIEFNESLAGRTRFEPSSRMTQIATWISEWCEKFIKR